MTAPGCNGPKEDVGGGGSRGLGHTKMDSRIVQAAERAFIPSIVLRIPSS
jgi:hypothetical protein